MADPIYDALFLSNVRSVSNNPVAKLGESGGIHRTNMLQHFFSWVDGRINPPDPGTIYIPVLDENNATSYHADSTNPIIDPGEIFIGKSFVGLDDVVSHEQTHRGFERLSLYAEENLPGLDVSLASKAGPAEILATYFLGVEEYAPSESNREKEIMAEMYDPEGNFIDYPDDDGYVPQIYERNLGGDWYAASRTQMQDQFNRMALDAAGLGYGDE